MHVLTRRENGVRHSERDFFFFYSPSKTNKVPLIPRRRSKGLRGGAEGEADLDLTRFVRFVSTKFWLSILLRRRESEASSNANAYIYTVLYTSSPSSHKIYPSLAPLRPFHPLWNAAVPLASINGASFNLSRIMALLQITHTNETQFSPYFKGCGGKCAPFPLYVDYTPSLDDGLNCNKNLPRRDDVLILGLADNSLLQLILP